MIMYPSYEEIELLRIKEEADWAKTVQEYAFDPHDFYRSWWYLTEHPIFQELLPPLHNFPSNYVHSDTAFNQDLLINVVKVSPETESIDDDETKNTETRVWLENGPQIWHTDEEFEADQNIGRLSYPTHDPDIDTGGNTYEEAIVNMARLVREKYGDDRSNI